MKATDHIELVRSIDEVPVAAWRQLLAQSSANSVFATWEWLKAWTETLGVNSDLLIPLIFRNDRLIGAAAFENRDGVVGFAARERRDYCDVLISDQLGDKENLELLGYMLEAVKSATPSFRCFELNRLPQTSPFLAATDGVPRFHITLLGTVPAPRMDMSVVEEKLRKKSLRRHANALARKGEVAIQTHTCADAITLLLESFFDQHVRRWQDTPSPSLFNEVANRKFYRALTNRLSGTGALRFSTVHLNGVMVAAHFGFFHAGIFTWYKPTFEPELAKHSPGEVLIKYLLERARDEGAEVFDFTIGDEEFKLRFATEVQQVYDLHLTDSLLNAWLRRGRMALGKLVRG